MSAAFVTAQLFLAFCYHSDAFTVTKYFGFSSVLLAALFAALFLEAKKDYILIQAGLLFTVLADIFLVLLSAEEKLAAMCLFSVTQICYFTLLYIRDNRFGKIHLAIRILTTLSALAGVIIVLGLSTDLLSLVSLFYYANLLVNVIWAFVEFKTSRLLALGLLLFALCDACIGFSVMDSMYISISEGSFLYFLANPGFNLAWVFYIPSQTLIALSLAEIKIRKSAV